MSRPSDPPYAGPRQGAPSLPSNPRKGSGGPPQNNRQNESADIQNRAARFEDEKRRIIESCFSKRDPDGTQQESYITHVRVIEDAQYPSSPPPPSSDPSNKKNRIVLVAVRRTGRVRVHKARENPTGTFSIGKTWHLDELSAVQTYTNAIPSNQQEQHEKAWASTTGFIVTLGKPYYWQAPTSKEKDFFIASLVKIYRKYTGGKLPDLPGFSPQELELLTGSPAGRTAQEQSPTPPPPQFVPPPQMPVSSAARAQSPYAANNPPRQNGPSQGLDGSGIYSRNAYRPPQTEESRPSMREERRPSAPREFSQSSREGQRNPTSFNKAVTQGPPTPTAPQFLQPEQLQPSISPKSSQSSFQSAQAAPQNRRNDGLMAPTTPGDAFRRSPAATQSQTSIPSLSTIDGPVSSRPSTAASYRTADIYADRPNIPEEGVPERRRPPIPQPQPSSMTYRTMPSGPNSSLVTPYATPSGLYKDATEVPTAVAETNIDSLQNSKPGLVDEEPTQPAAQSVEVPASTTATTLMAAPADNPEQTTQGMTEEPEQLPTPKKVDAEHRPGLGPMVKKKSSKDVASQFRKMALAASAFQPRQGGAAARLKALQEHTTDEPDGITRVVPAPLFRGMSSDSARSPTPDVASSVPQKDRPSTPLGEKFPPTVQIQRTATEDSIRTPKMQIERTRTADSVMSAEPEIGQAVAAQEKRPQSPEKPRSRSPNHKRRQRQQAEMKKYCKSLDIDPKIIEGRDAAIGDLLTEFGWDGRLKEDTTLEVFEADLRREIGRAQATGWLGHIDQQESKVQDLAKAFERAIAECEELDGLLTLYSHELDTLHEDIEYIEAQSSGLQVQTANQKSLHAELDRLLTTLQISKDDLGGLQSGSLDNPDGVHAVESSLSLLYKAMLEIDPKIRRNKFLQSENDITGGNGLGTYADAEIGQMRAVRECKDSYQSKIDRFLGRFRQHITSTFKMVEQRGSEDNSQNAGASTTSLNLKTIQSSRQELWMYSAIMLFVREINHYEWQTLITSYEMNMKGTYQDQFRDSVMSQRRTTRKPNGDEQEALFTHQERDKGDDSLTSSAARKLTVKRGKTTKTSALRQSLGDRKDGKPDAWEVFDRVLQQQAKVVAEEQNFFVRFFHLNSQSNVDFVELVARAPDQRRLPNISTKQGYDPDRSFAKIVQQTSEGIFSFWSTDLHSLMEWVLSTDKLQTVGVLCALEQVLGAYEETNQEYISRTVRSMHERLTGVFHKFVEDQVKAIEETKVKVKKRKGVISFMRTFPVFSATVEDMIPHEFANNEALEVRFIINEAYGKILKAMWESLTFIAKDDPGSSAAGTRSAVPAGGDPEDKEALNYHILLIENMSHYLEEVDTRHNVVLDEWAERARHDLLSHLTQYTDSVIRRPLGKWLDFLESTEALMKTMENHAGIASKPSHSRSSAKKVLSSHDAREMRKGVETLKKRIEKHFGDVDDPSSMSKSLVGRVFEECGTRYAHAYDRMRTVIDGVYDGNLDIDWRKEEVVGMFKR